MGIKSDRIDGVRTESLVCSYGDGRAGGPSGHGEEGGGGPNGRRVRRRGHHQHHHLLLLRFQHPGCSAKHLHHLDLGEHSRLLWRYRASAPQHASRGPANRSTRISWTRVLSRGLIVLMCL
jgi:hypothetical protein